jgi:hypothetical protein
MLFRRPAAVRAEAGRADAEYYLLDVRAPAHITPGPRQLVFEAPRETHGRHFSESGTAC